MTVRLDQTQIAIRERSPLEIFDLTLHAIRAHAGGLALTALLGMIPLAVFNGWLLADRLDEIPLDWLSFFESGPPMGYLLLMLLLVVAEIPLATALMTLYLGHAVFTERPRAGQIAREWFESLPQLLLYQGLLRPLFVLFRPFLSEVILLERNPLRARDGSGRSTGQRSRSLHRGNGDAFGRWVITVPVGGMLLGAIFGSISFLRAVLFSEWAWDRTTYQVLFPLALWIVIGYLTVARFLSYLDLRIRREGWEVELALRAEERHLKRLLA